jgi:hypothetical protein
MRSLYQECLRCGGPTSAKSSELIPVLGRCRDCACRSWSTILVPGRVGHRIICQGHLNFSETFTFSVCSQVFSWPVHAAAATAETKKMKAADSAGTLPRAGVWYSNPPYGASGCWIQKHPATRRVADDTHQPGQLSSSYHHGSR